MSIPAVNFTIQDGALGGVPANVSQVCCKMGISSKATASVAASAFVASATSPDGIAYTAQVKGAGGNQISIAYVSGGALAVAVSGNAIQVTIVPGTTTNANIVAAIAGNAQANALVAGVATGGSDHAVVTSQVYLGFGTYFLPSTTGGDGVQFSSKAAGVSVTVTSGSATEAPVITLVGNAITIQIKAATTLNSDVVSGIAGNASAAALVTAIATGPSDLSVTASVQSLSAGTLGVTGTIDTVFTEANPTQAVSDLGYGPLTEAVCHSLDIAGGQVQAMELNPSVAGTNSAVSQVGAGPAVSVSGSPNDAYSVIVNVTTGGALGVGQFQYSQDGGNDFSSTFVIPSGGTFVIPNTGLTLTFAAGTYVVGTSYAFTCVAPGYTITDVQNASAALIGGPFASQFGFLHLVGTASSVAGSAAMAAALEVLALSYASSYFIFTHWDMECANDTDANIASAFANTVCTRVDVCAGFETVQSSIPGSGVLTRNLGFSAAAREALVPVQNDLGRVKDGPLPGVLSILRDESVTPDLDNLAFTTARTIRGKPGFYITNGHMFETPSSDYLKSQNRRVMDLACTIAYPATVQYLNDTLRLNAAGGTITPAQAATIQDQVNAQLKAGLTSKGAAIATQVIIDQTNNVYASNTVNETIRVQPFGYARFINVNIGFLNPTLAV